MIGLTGLLLRFMAIALRDIPLGKNLPRLTSGTAFGLAISASELCILIFSAAGFSVL
jgi:hypothetical protein